MKHVVLIAGPQGAGKGTIAAIIAKQFGLLHLSVGDLLRDEIKRGTEIGNSISDRLKEGHLAPHDLVVEIVRKRLEQPDAQKGVLLDGIPRDPEQVELLNKVVDVSCVLLLEIPDDMSVKRISGRFICSKCGAVFGSEIPPKIRGICDKCGSALVQRDDDKPEAVRERLRIYHEQTEPALVSYGDKVRRIDATGTVPEIAASAASALAGCLR